MPFTPRSRRGSGVRSSRCIWIEQTEGAKLWMKVFADLQSRGCQDILIAVTDGLETRGHFPTDDAATKLIWLALRNITAGWWKAANYWHLYGEHGRNGEGQRIITEKQRFQRNGVDVLRCFVNSVPL
jgi:transposase-like protein